MNCISYIVIAWKLLLDVCLPILDLISDLYFTWDVYSRGQEEEIYYESYLQASLQIYIILNDGVPHGSPSWIGNDDIPLNAVFRISSVIISCVSLFYGLCKIDLRNITTSEPGTCLTIKLFLIEFLTKIALFLRVLICFSLYCVDENMLTYAIIYTCLDCIPIIIFIKLVTNCSPKDSVIIIKNIGVKSILDPSRFFFKVSKDKNKHNERNTMFSLFWGYTIWYSFLGMKFSIVFIDHSCDEFESCDQDADRINRFHAFFRFSLVINVLAVVYGLASLFYTCINDKTLFQPVFPEELREEETNV